VVPLSLVEKNVVVIKKSKQEKGAFMNELNRRKISGKV